MRSLHSVDWLIIVGYLMTMAGVGFYFSSRQTNLSRFLLADRSMGWLPVGMSLMAALNSGMDYLMQPSSTIRYGLVLALGILSWLALYPFVAHIAFPFYRRLRFYSVYEYLEARFDVRVRVLGASIFLLWRLGWMGTAMYVPGLAISAATGGQVDAIVVTIVVGVLVTLYTMLGGIQAVIWNDVVQFCIMFGGLAATVWIVLASVPGGLGEIWQVAADSGKLDLWPPLVGAGATGWAASVSSFFSQPITAVTLLVTLIVGRLAQYTADQVMVQRLQTTQSLTAARRAFVVNAAGDALWMVGLSFVGLALFAYFQRHVLPAEAQADRLLPYFMSQAFPPAAVGLVLAAIAAASLSSIDSAINACTSVAVVDFYHRLWRGRDVRDADQSAAQSRVEVRISRMATVCFGATGTVLACNVSRFGSLLEINARVVNAFTGPLFGIFLLAMFSARARAEGVLAAGVAGAVTAYYVAYHSAIGFLWPSTFGLAATLGLGAAIGSLWPAAAAHHGRGLTWRAVMQRDEEPRASMS